MVKDRRIVFHVDAEQAEALKAESARTGAPVSEILRRALTQPLVGKFFHSVNDDKETIKWQGRIKAEVSHGLFLVQFFEWLTGSESNQQIIPAAEMAHWKIYDSAEEMNEAYGDYEQRRHTAKSNLA